jgi:hypothetical protein
MDAVGVLVLVPRYEFYKYLRFLLKITLKYLMELYPRCFSNSATFAFKTHVTLQ